MRSTYMYRRMATAAVVCVMLLASVACTEKESNIGVELQDPSTLFNGISDTAYGVAWTVRDDSLLTSNLSSGLIGCFADPSMGHNEAIFYTQVALAGRNVVEFDQHSHIDSIVLKLSLEQLFSSSDNIDGYNDLHFEVMQLAEPLTKDTSYYASTSLPVGDVCLFNGVSRICVSDTMTVSMRLDDKIIELFENKRYSTSDELAEAVKGLRIRLLNDGNPIMANVNFASANTTFSIHFTYSNDTSSMQRVQELVIGRTAVHFIQFKNTYSGEMSFFNDAANDSLSGSRYLYLNPMGGTNISLDFSVFAADFHSKHPHAVVHYAELLLPKADIAPALLPDVIAAFKYGSDGQRYSIPDLTDSYTSRGYDGSYHEDRGCYRMRVTQHLQKVLSEGTDRGMLLVLNSRRVSPRFAVVNGSDASLNAGNCARIQFVYSE